MKLASPYERLQQLIGMIELSPTKKQIVKFLSYNACPEGEVCGVTWMTLQDDGNFHYDHVYGISSTLDPDVQVSLTDDNVVPLALRSGKTQLFDMAQMYKNFKGATHYEALSVYPSGLTMPITDRQVLGMAFNGSYETLKTYVEYFECIRLVLSLWQSKLDFNSKTIATTKNNGSEALTERQQAILELIKEGRTNASIGSILRYSESLIRQESIIIYRKLGADGRKSLIALDSNEDNPE